MPLTAVVAAVLFGCMLPWLPMGNDQDRQQLSEDPYSTRRMFMSTCVIALTTTVLIKMPFIAYALIAMATAACLTCEFIQRPSMRLPLGALLACMTLPFAWLCTGDSLLDAFPLNLLLIFGLPAFVPVYSIGHLLGHHPEELDRVAFLLSTIELMIGVWVARLGPKRSIGYSLGVLVTSALGSLVLHQMVIA